MHFDYWRQRLDEELGQPEASHAILLLDHVCQDASGLSRDALGRALSTRSGAGRTRPNPAAICWMYSAVMVIWWSEMDAMPSAWNGYGCIGNGGCGENDLPCRPALYNPP